jgi:molybdenum cofactor cytidylyltransferase
MNAAPPQLHAVVLAAGASRRFGAIKSLALCAGEPLLQRVIACAQAAAAHTWVVLGAHRAELAPLAAQRAAAIVFNPHWPEGLGSSIRAAVLQLPASCTAVLLVLGDQARLEPQDLCRLAQAWRSAPEAIVAARYGTVLGAPVIFPRRCFRALRQLRGDAGARTLIERDRAAVIAVEMPNAAFDVDTVADLATVEAAVSSGETGL